MDSPKTPTALGYRMPAEWEPHEATWLSWPKPEGISFPESYDAIPPVLCKMVAALADSERVCINVRDADEEQIVRGHFQKNNAPSAHVTFFHIPTNEPWCRDHGPIFLVRDEAPRKVIVDWGYNAWGWKYPPCDLDDIVPARVGEMLDLPVYHPGMILEGGSIDVNGSGSLITTKSCLLNENRNPSLSQKEIELRMKDFLGVRHILWLGDGIEGDDTDGHVDDLTRFIDQTTVVTVVEEDEKDPNHLPLAENLAKLREMKAENGRRLDVLTLPMPSRIMRQGQRLPASYANFYIGNTVLLLPTFADCNDKWAVAVLEKAFPTRRIVPIDCRELIWGLGAFHCLTQQEPKV